MLFLIPIMALVLVLLGRSMLHGYRRYRMQAVLRREWWPRFERDLRRYMRHT